jgi:hypothetical protein
MILGLLDPYPDPLAKSTDPDADPAPLPFSDKSVERTEMTVAN